MVKSGGRPIAFWAWCALVGIGTLVHLVNKGHVQLQLPYPAVNARVEMYPADVFPWQPRPDEGAFTSNSRLAAVRQFQGLIDGSESVIVSPDGRATMLSKFGGVYEAVEQPDGSFALNTTARAWLGPGRPLGAGFDARGDLYVCDALKGLMMLEAATNRVVVASNRVSRSSALGPGSPITYANDLDIAKNGSVFFTTSVDMTLHKNAPHYSRFTHVPSLEGRGGFWDTVRGWGLGMCQGKPQGKLYRYDPATRETHLLATGFFYSNGIALSEDDSFLVISETDRLRLVKFWLQGPKAGQMEVMIDHLPATPDGLARAPDGNFWAALLARVPPASLYFHLPLVRWLLPQLRESLRPPVPEWGGVLKVSPEGEVLEFLEDPRRPASAYRISSAHEHNGRLWLGALTANFVSYVDLSALPPKPQETPATWTPRACRTPPCAYVSEYH